MIMAALIFLWAICLYLFGLGAMMLLAPDRARQFLSAFAQTPKANLIEAGIRFLAGLACVVVAPSFDYPSVVYWIGLFLAATALLFVVAPTLHRRFAARSVAAVLPFLPLLGVSSIALAVLLAAYLPNPVGF